MITKELNSEFGAYEQKYNHGYKVSSFVKEPICIDVFVEPNNPDMWLNCPCCGLKPKIWEFDNGRQTACGCANDKYNHFSVVAESIMSCHVRNNGNLSEYDGDALRKNWNEYCQTMVSPCSHGDLYLEGKW